MRSVLAHPVSYSLASGAVAATTGTAASLLATGTARVIAWAAVTTVVSAIAGLVRQ